MSPTIAERLEHARQCEWSRPGPTMPKTHRNDHQSGRCPDDCQRRRPLQQHLPLRVLETYSRLRLVQTLDRSVRTKLAITHEQRRPRMTRRVGSYHHPRWGQSRPYQGLFARDDPRLHGADDHTNVDASRLQYGTLLDMRFQPKRPFPRGRDQWSGLTAVL